MTTVALAEARVHPAVALLQSLLCHAWLACSSCKSQRLAAVPAADQREDTAQQLPLQAEHSEANERRQQPHEWQAVLQSQQAEEAEGTPRHPPYSILHQDRELVTQHEQLRQEAAPQLSHQYHPQQALSTQYQAVNIPGPATLHCNEQTYQLPFGPQEQNSATLAWRSMSAMHADTHTIYLELAVCAVTLAALPFVAWVKQPTHMRQWACWQDALPATFVAMHASLLCVLVGASCPVSLHMVTVASTVGFIDPSVHAIVDRFSYAKQQFGSCVNISIQCHEQSSTMPALSQSCLYGSTSARQGVCSNPWSPIDHQHSAMLCFVCREGRKLCAYVTYNMQLLWTKASHLFGTCMSMFFKLPCFVLLPCTSQLQRCMINHSERRMVLSLRAHWMQCC